MTTFPPNHAGLQPCSDGSSTHTCSSSSACQLGTGFTTKLAVLVLLLRGDNHSCGDNPKIAASPLLWGEECDPPVCLRPAAPLEAVVWDLRETCGGTHTNPAPLWGSPGRAQAAWPPFQGPPQGGGGGVRPVRGGSAAVAVAAAARGRLPRPRPRFPSPVAAAAAGRDRSGAEPRCQPAPSHPDPSWGSAGEGGEGVGVVLVVVVGWGRSTRGPMR